MRRRRCRDGATGNPCLRILPSCYVIHVTDVAVLMGLLSAPLPSPPHVLSQLRLAPLGRVCDRACRRQRVTCYGAWLYGCPRQRRLASTAAMAAATAAQGAHDAPPDADVPTSVAVDAVRHDSGVTGDEPPAPSPPPLAGSPPPRHPLSTTSPGAADRDAAPAPAPATATAGPLAVHVVTVGGDDEATASPRTAASGGAPALEQ